MIEPVELVLRSELVIEVTARLVVVAWVVVESVAVKFWSVVEPSDVRVPDGNVKDPAPNVAPVTREAGSDPVVSVIARPSDEVASC